MADGIIKKITKKASDAMADFVGVPRQGEEEIDMHNRQTEDFLAKTKKAPGDKQFPTASEMRKKQGPGAYQTDIGEE